MLTDKLDSKRDETLDVLKGIGIILMVIGHTGVPFREWIYLFHMPIFLIASGYLWNPKNSVSFSSVKKYISKKIITLWVPYIIINIFAVLFNNFFLMIGIYAPSDTALPNVYVSEYWDNITMLKKIIKVICFGSAGGLTGVTWYLRMLFVVSVCHMILVYVEKNIPFKKFYWLLIIILFCIFSAFVNYRIISIINSISQLFICYLTYLFGIGLKKTQINSEIKKHPYIYSCIGFTVLCLLSQFDTIELSEGKYVNCIFYVLAIVSGWCLVFGISSIIKGWVRIILADLGRASLWILMFHMLSFKIVTFIYIKVTDTDIAYLAQFPIPSGKEWLWIIYSVVGVLIPFSIANLIKIFKRNYQSRKVQI